MIENILLGLKDIYKNKFVFILLQVMVVLICIVIISTSLTMKFAQVRISTNTLQEQFEFVPTSNDMSNNMKFVNEIYKEIKDKSMTYFTSLSLSMELDTNVIVVLGDGNQFSSNLSKTMDDTTVFYTKKDGKNKEILLNDKAYSLHYLDQRSIYNQDLFNNTDSSMYIVFINENTADQWFDLEDGTSIIQMMDNIKIGKINIEAISRITKNSFIQMVERKSYDSETSFVLTYIYPYLFFVIITIFIAFFIFNKYSLSKMKKEFVIHILCGAKVTDILLRNSVMMIASLAIDFACITPLIRTESDPIVNIAYPIIIFMIVIFECMMLYQLKTLHFMDNIRND